MKVCFLAEIIFSNKVMVPNENLTFGKRHSFPCPIWRKMAKWSETWPSIWDTQIFNSHINHELRPSESFPEEVKYVIWIHVTTTPLLLTAPLLASTRVGQRNLLISVVVRSDDPWRAWRAGSNCAEPNSTRDAGVTVTASGGRINSTQLRSKAIRSVWTK